MVPKTVAKLAKQVPMPKVKPPRYTITLKAALAELVAMTLFVYIGCGE